MYNMLLVSTDPGFLVLSQKFIPFEDPSIKVMPEGSIKDAVAALSDGTVDAIIFDHSENNDISDMIGGIEPSGEDGPNRHGLQGCVERRSHDGPQRGRLRLRRP